MTIEEVDRVTEEEFLNDPAYDTPAYMEIGRRIWVVLQCSLGIYWAYMGYRNYCKIQSEFTKAKFILVSGGLIFFAVLFNEFVFKTLDMIFILLGLANYINFNTFCLVIDACQTEEKDASWSK